MAKPLKSSFFSEYVKPSQIVFDFKAKEKVEAIEELLGILVKQKLIKNKELILTRVINRERLESTGIGHGVAVPHARVDTGGEIAVAVGMSKAGMDFEAIDNKKVYLIILVIWNPSIPGLFNHLFASLASFLRKPDYRRRIFEAKNKTELYNVLSEIELKLPQGEAIISRASLLKKLQNIEMKKKKASAKQKRDIQKQADMIRDELDQSLVARFDRLMERYGFAVAEVEDGACQGCNINVATQMSSAIEGSNDIFVCENCGKFLIASRKKKK